MSQQWSSYDFFDIGRSVDAEGSSIGFDWQSPGYLELGIESGVELSRIHPVQIEPIQIDPTRVGSVAKPRLVEDPQRKDEEVSLPICSAEAVEIVVPDPLIEVEPTGAPLPASPVADLVDLIERLSQRIGVLESERSEAIAAGHHLADERDRYAAELGLAVTTLRGSNNDIKCLHHALEDVHDAVVELSSSPLAIPVRGRLRAILAV